MDHTRAGVSGAFSSSRARSAAGVEPASSCTPDHGEWWSAPRRSNLRIQQSGSPVRRRPSVDLRRQLGAGQVDENPVSRSRVVVLIPPGDSSRTCSLSQAASGSVVTNWTISTRAG